MSDYVYETNHIEKFDFGNFLVENGCVKFFRTVFETINGNLDYERVKRENVRILENERTEKK